jgi:hypothetical protein
MLLPMGRRRSARTRGPAAWSPRTITIMVPFGLELGEFRGRLTLKMPGRRKDPGRRQGPGDPWQAAAHVRGVAGPVFYRRVACKA